MTFMKAAIIVGAALLVISAVSPVSSYGQSESTAIDTTLSVDAVARSPKAFADREIVVTGVVGTVVSKQKIFTIIDRSEYAECKVVTCARYEIPIEFDGKLPKPEQVVVATGRLVQREPGRFLFKAGRVAVIK